MVVALELVVECAVLDSVAVDSITDSEVADSAVLAEVDLVGATATGDGHTAMVIGAMVTMDSTIPRTVIMMLMGIMYVPMVIDTVITNFLR